MIHNMIGGGSGGGGSALTVVGGTTRPPKATHNTIWANTANEITGYVLSGEEPANPTTGMLWVTIGNTGTIKVASTVGDDWITVYPLNASQYINNTWEKVEVLAYQNGEWNRFLLYVYDRGEEYTAFIPVGKREDANHGKATTPTVTDNGDSVTFSLSKNTSERTGGIVYTETKYDLANFTKIKLDYDCSIAGAASVAQMFFCVYSDIGTYAQSNVVIKQELKNGSGMLEVDVSSVSQECHIGFWLYTYTTNGAGAVKITVNSMWLE